MMLRYWLAYFFLIGFGVFFYSAFVGYFSYYFLLVILILPIVSLLYLLACFKFTKLDFKVGKAQRIDEEVRIDIIKDCLGLGTIKFVIDQQKYLIKGNQNELLLSFKHCGGQKLIIENYYQYDCLNLFWIKKKCYYELPITIYPRVLDFDFNDYQPLLPKDGENLYAVNQKGDDPTEIYDIHQYQPGDLLKNVHWKRSAKYQEIWVKENAKVISEVISIYCRFDDNADHNDLLFAYLEAFCDNLSASGFSFILSGKEITSIQEYHEAFIKLLWNPFDVGEITKHRYEFVVDYQGIVRMAGDHR